MSDEISENEARTIGLQIVYEEHARDCKRCALHETRTNVVFGEGNFLSPKIAFMGEGPGEDEDKLGRPFVGKAGQLLDKMLVAMGISRADVYILNTVNCRPPGNRKPRPAEIEACRPFHVSQLKLVKPAAIVTLGATATDALLGLDRSMTLYRGKWYEWEGIPVRPTWHPAFLLRDPSHKLETWDDLKAVAEKVGIVIPEKT